MSSSLLSRLLDRGSPGTASGDGQPTRQGAGSVPDLSPNADDGPLRATRASRRAVPGAAVREADRALRLGAQATFLPHGELPSTAAPRLAGRPSPLDGTSIAA